MRLGGRCSSGFSIGEKKEFKALGSSTFTLNLSYVIYTILLTLFSNQRSEPSGIVLKTLRTVSVWGLPAHKKSLW